MNKRLKKKKFNQHWFTFRVMGWQFNSHNCQRADAGTRRFYRSLRNINKFRKDLVADINRVPKASRCL